MTEIKGDQDYSAGVVLIANGDQTDVCMDAGMEFTELYTLTDCKFAEIRGADGFRIDGVCGPVIPPGVALRVRAVQIRLDSGSVIAYYAKSVDKLTAPQ